MIAIRTMTPADVSLGMALKEQAGWNQLADDWQRALYLEPTGCFVAAFDGQAAGTATTCIFDSVAWIALVLVDAAYRNRGIGKALLEHALVFLDGQGVRSVRLDATPLGQPLYEKLGFAEEYPLARYDGIVTAIEALPTSGVTAAGPDDLPDIQDLDRRTTGTDRRKLLSYLHAAQPETWRIVRENGTLTGFAAARPGCNALHLGPCLATTTAGPLLLADAWHRYPGQRVFLDIPQDNRAAVHWAAAHGLAVQRPLMRMCRGPAPAEDYTSIWATFGPEKG